MKQTLRCVCACLLIVVGSVVPVHAAPSAPASSPLHTTGDERLANDPPTARFVASSAVVAVEEGRAVIPVTLSEPPARDVEVTVVVGRGTSSPQERVARHDPSTTLTFRAGASQPQEVVLPLQADAFGEEGVAYMDLMLQSDDVPLGTPQTFRLWIRKAALYPGLQAHALADRLRGDFRPAAVLSAEQAPDTLLGAVWSATGIVRSVFSGTRAVISTKDRPRTVAQEQGVEVDNVWPAAIEDDTARRDLHLLMPVQADVRAARRGGKAFSRGVGEAAGAAGPYLRPRDAMKGDVARALLYFYTLYPERADGGVLERLKPVLAQWMDDDPVDANELRRSTTVAYYQGRPNPFVIAPELAERVFNLRDTYPTPTVSFVQQSASVSEADSMATIELAVVGVGDEDVTFDLALDEAASTVDENDLEGFQRRSVTVPAGTPDGAVQRLQVPIARDDAAEDTERASFVLENLSGFAQPGEVVRHELNIENAEQPSREDSGRVTLGPAYPNPVSPGQGATVQFDLTMDEAVPFTVEVFSTLGQRVHARSYSAGEANRMNNIEVDAEDFPSGLYIVRLRGPSFSTTETFVVVR